MTHVLFLLVGSLLMAPASEREIRLKWNLPQSQFLRIRAVAGGPTEYIDIEGAVRAGKSTPAAAKLATYAIEYPGIHMAAARWSQDNLDAQVKPLWRDTARKLGIALRWNTEEQYDELDNGSRVYLRALKAGEGIARYGKLAGLTLAVLWADQPEEAPEDVIQAYVPARLSQPGYPHEVWYTPNPPAEDHWLVGQFPEDNSLPHHTYIRTSVYDNRHNLGDQYIADLEAAYPVGSALRRRFIEGKRGLMVSGKPVYGGYFDRARHAVAVEMNPDLPLVETIDFGHHHPCVLWQQFTPWGGLHWLGGLMGADMFIEDFAPLVLQYRSQWFPRTLEVWNACDPAGSHQNSQGVNKNGVTVLNDNGIFPRWVDNSNSPELRDGAVQTIGGYLRRRTIKGAEAFQIHPTRWLVVSRTEAAFRPFAVDAFEAGYVWDPRARRVGSRLVNVPAKDGYYEHVMNCGEYGVINFGPAQPSKVDERKIERAAEKRAQQDKDPYDARARAVRMGNRRGRARSGY